MDLEELGLTRLYSGKVRDVYGLGEDYLLLVATDRMSAFDVVMRETVPHKGRVLTGLTDFWAREFGLTCTSLVTCDPVKIDEVVPGFGTSPELHGRTMLVRRAEMLPLECIVRGRLAGQAFDEYQARGTIHDMPAPRGLALTDAFDEPLFTPSTKEASGHDRNISHAEAASLVGAEVLERASELVRRVFTLAASRLLDSQLVLADSKFELGWVDGELVICDEMVTPDSSRIWPARDVKRSEVPPSFDKQAFRDWLTKIGWDRTPPPPTVPNEVLTETSRRYVECYELSTGRHLSDWYGL